MGFLGNRSGGIARIFPKWERDVKQELHFPK